MPFSFHPHSLLVDERRTLDYLRQFYDHEAFFGRPFLDIYESSLDETHAGINPYYALNKVRRCWLLCKLFLKTRGVRGDVAECGVYKGSTSRLLVEIMKTGKLDPHGQQFLLFDSYEGLPVATAQDSFDFDPKNPEQSGQHFAFEARRFFDTSAEHVAKVFAQWPWVSIEKGWVPNVFTPHTDRNFAFVHIDVDLYQPTLDCLSFFVPRLSEGGLIVCDDYLSPEFPGARRAWDEYCGSNAIKFIVLDSHQAVISK